MPVKLIYLKCYVGLLQTNISIKKRKYDVLKMFLYWAKGGKCLELLKMGKVHSLKVFKTRIKFWIPLT